MLGTLAIHRSALRPSAPRRDAPTMSDTHATERAEFIPAKPLSSPAPAPVSRSPISVETKNGRKLRMTRRVQHCIDLMVWDGLKRDDAAEKAGMKANSLYVALRKPDVRAYYLSECEVLRTSGRARRIHRLEQMAEQDDNKQAAVNAIRALDNISDEQQASIGASRSPGFQIVIVNSQSQPKPLIELNPLPQSEG